MAEVAKDGQLDDPRLTRRERAALAFTDRFWHDHHAIDDELFAELMHEFSPGEFIELAMSVGQNIAMGKLVAMLGIPNPNFGDQPDHTHPDHT